MILTPAQIKAADARNIDIDAQGCGFDYANQAWIISGKYHPCGHVGTRWPCNCYGRIHSGESANLEAAA